MVNLRNVGPLDATVRVLLGLVLLGHAATLGDRPFLAIAWGSVALLALGTGALRICPIYTLIRSLGFPRPTSMR